MHHRATENHRHEKKLTEVPRAQAKSIKTAAQPAIRANDSLKDIEAALSPFWAWRMTAH